MIDIMVFLGSRLRMLAARVPVQAPVPGIGIATKRKSAKYTPFLAFFKSLSPAFSPFLRQNAQNSLNGFHLHLLVPHSSTFLARKKMIGTGIIFPMIATSKTSHSGRPRSMPIATGIAPLSSINGTIEINRTISIFQNILP